mmetsp:Transcript_3301/g.6824  ORF Transcript_3301/g.6824 Transcript_3301/m.6824 type:complete len:331 (-) Transcript_3301:514-1506(-)
MNATGMTAHFIVDIEKGAQFITNLFKATSLDAGFRLVGVTMDGVGNPQDGFAFPLDGTNQAGQIFAQLFGSHTHNNGQTSGDVLRIHGINDFNQFFGSALVGDLDSQGIANAADKFQMSAVQLSCAFSDPQHVSGAVVPTVRGGILACQGLFVGEQQAFMSHVEISLGKGGRACVNANGLHETKGFIHLVGKLAVTTSFRSIFDKIQIPRMQTTNIGISSRRKGAENIERLCRLMVGSDHIVWIVSTSFGSEFFGIDNITPVGRQRHITPHFIGFTAGFGKLSRHASDFNDGHGTAKGQHQSHLQNDPKGITHMIHIEFIKGFGTITTHE